MLLNASSNKYKETFFPMRCLGCFMWQGATLDDLEIARGATCCGRIPTVFWR